MNNVVKHLSVSIVGFVSVSLFSHLFITDQLGRGLLGLLLLSLIVSVVLYQKISNHARFFMLVFLTIPVWLGWMLNL